MLKKSCPTRYPGYRGTMHGIGMIPSSPGAHSGMNQFIFFISLGNQFLESRDGFLELTGFNG